MEIEPEKKNKSSILKKLEGYLSMNRRRKSSPPPAATRSRFSKSKSWHSNTSQAIAPNGYFSVYVGPEGRRFVIKTKYANHPLFRMLLEDAESEYGFKSDGPLQLPCEVDLFCQVLAEMECVKKSENMSCGYGYGSCSPFVNPARRLGKTDMAKGYSPYGLLTPPRWLKINHF